MLFLIINTIKIGSLLHYICLEIDIRTVNINFPQMQNADLVKRYIVNKQLSRLNHLPDTYLNWESILEECMLLFIPRSHAKTGFFKV